MEEKKVVRELPPKQLQFQMSVGEILPQPLKLVSS